MPALIGLLHSTRFTDPWKAELRKGLSDGKWPPSKATLVNQSVDAEGDYGPGHDALKNEAKNHHKKNKVNIIVAAGGLVSALAASDAMTELKVIKPIVYLIGRIPINPGEEGYNQFANDPNLVGGLDFATAADNDARRDELVKQFSKTKFAVTPDTVALLVNTNSAMWGAELVDWNKPNQYLLYPDLLTGTTKANDPKIFMDFFQAVSEQKNPPTAIIVSADPFFFRYRTWIMKAAQHWLDVPFCFAFEEYKQSPDWDDKKYIVVPAGNTLSSGYYKLGLKAAKALDNLFPHPLGTEKVRESHPTRIEPAASSGKLPSSREACYFLPCGGGLAARDRGQCSAAEQRQPLRASNPRLLLLRSAGLLLLTFWRTRPNGRPPVGRFLKEC